jgi:beta-xylosidase
MRFINSAIVFAVLCLSFHVASAQQEKVSSVWVADQGNGTYKNPILHADYSDPDAIRVGDEYYMTSSSFNCIPGLPILHSRDLVNWQLVNYALKKQEPTELYESPQHGKGVWAPSINFRKGEYRIYYPDPDFGIFMVKTKNPLGDWEKPVLILKGKGIIDPSVFWDDDGEAYLAVAWAGSRAGVNSLLTVFKMNDEGTEVTDDGRHVYDGHDHNHTVEGPKFYKKNGFYYLFAPAGGVSTGWQLVLRAKNIYGPYEEKVVIDQGKTMINGPHQGALVQTQRGEDWFLHFQDKGPYGRVVHLQPVIWKNDWPVIGTDIDGDGKGEPVQVYKKPNVGKIYPVMTPEESDEFNKERIGLQWQWNANPKVQWSANIAGSGFLRLFAYPTPEGTKNLWPVSNLLLQKFPSPDFSATTKVKWNIEWDIWQGKKAGLLVMGNDYAYLSITKNEKGYNVNQVVCKDALSQGTEAIVATKPIKSATVYLKVQVSSPDASCNFSYSEDGVNYTKIGQPFKAQQDKWIGAKIGLFCTSAPDVRTGSYADFDYFRIDK